MEITELKLLIATADISFLKSMKKLTDLEIKTRELVHYKPRPIVDRVGIDFHLKSFEEGTPPKLSDQVSEGRQYLLSTEQSQLITGMFSCKPTKVVTVKEVGYDADNKAVALFAESMSCPRYETGGATLHSFRINDLPRFFADCLALEAYDVVVCDNGNQVKKDQRSKPRASKKTKKNKELDWLLEAL